ncbi:sugar phosphate nucleotidyltransferase, partial [Campylobacter jejuni]
VDMSDNSVQIHNTRHEPWKVTMLYTGQDSMTGGRILYAKPYVGNETFMLTYGDGVSDVNIKELVNFHKGHGKAITMTSVLPEGKFGALDIDNTTNRIKSFTEKPKGDASLSNAGWINGGFFVCESKVFDYIKEGDETIFEQTPLRNLAQDGELYSYKHHGFWKCMDTLKDKNDLTKMWINNKAPWALWN